MGQVYRGPWGGHEDGPGARDGWQEALDRRHDQLDDDLGDDLGLEDGDGWGAGPSGRGPLRTAEELVADAGDALRTGGRTTAAQVLAAGREAEVDLAVRRLLLEVLALLLKI